MAHARLRRLLEELREELAMHPATDPEARDSLKRLSADVEAALGRLDEAEAGEPDFESLVERLQEAQERFVVHHPSLAAAIGSVLNTLSGSGV